MPGFVQRKLIGKPQVSTLENLPLSLLVLLRSWGVCSREDEIRKDVMHVFKDLSPRKKFQDSFSGSL